MLRLSRAKDADMVNFDQFGEFELNCVELVECLTQVAAGRATPSTVDLGCTNVLCSPTDLICGATNLCITDTACLRNPVCKP